MSYEKYLKEGLCARRTRIQREIRRVNTIMMVVKTLVVVNVFAVVVICGILASR